jgi:hypothetical protein
MSQALGLPLAWNIGSAVTLHLAAILPAQLGPLAIPPTRLNGSWAIERAHLGRFPVSHQKSMVQLLRWKPKLEAWRVHACNLNDLQESSPWSRSPKRDSSAPLLPTHRGTQTTVTRFIASPVSAVIAQIKEMRLNNPTPTPFTATK